MARRAPPHPMGHNRIYLAVLIAVLLVAGVALLLQLVPDTSSAAVRTGVQHVVGRLPCTEAGEDDGEGAFQDVWDAGGDLPPIPAVPYAAVHVVSSSGEDAAGGVGARLLTLRGLDASFAPVREVLALTGTTPARASRAFRVVHGAEVSGPHANVGEVSVRGDGELLALVRPTLRASFAARLVVPLAHAGTISGWGARVNRVARVGMPRAALFALRLNGTPLDVGGEWSGASGGAVPQAVPVREGDVVSVSVQSGAGGMDVSAWFDVDLQRVD